VVASDLNAQEMRKERCLKLQAEGQQALSGQDFSNEEIFTGTWQSTAAAAAT
jgi:hypothetical protein